MFRALKIMGVISILCITVIWQTTFADDDPAAAAKGKVLYNQYCASCHGLDGTGNGPAAASLKVAPPDLRTLQTQGEEFPGVKVMLIIEGEKNVPAHGSTEMPVWGKVLTRTRGLAGKGDIYGLVHYIQSIQKAH